MSSNVYRFSRNAGSMSFSRNRQWSTARLVWRSTRPDANRPNSTSWRGSAAPKPSRCRPPAAKAGRDWSPGRSRRGADLDARLIGTPAVDALAAGHLEAASKANGRLEPFPGASNCVSLLFTVSVVASGPALERGTRNHLNVFGDRRDRQIEHELRHTAGDDDGEALGGLESIKGSCQVIAGGRQIEESEEAFTIRHLLPDFVITVVANTHRDAGQPDRSVLRRDRSQPPARRRLSERRQRD